MGDTSQTKIMSLQGAQFENKGCKVAPQALQNVAIHNNFFFPSHHPAPEQIDINSRTWRSVGQQKVSGGGSQLTN